MIKNRVVNPRRGLFLVGWLSLGLGGVELCHEDVYGRYPRSLHVKKGIFEGEEGGDASGSVVCHDAAGQNVPCPKYLLASLFKKMGGGLALGVCSDGQQVFIPTRATPSSQTYMGLTNALSFQCRKSGQTLIGSFIPWTNVERDLL